MDISTSLLKACKNGRQDAYRKMYESTIAYCYSVVARYIVEQDVKDVVQDCYASLYTSLHNYDSKKGVFKSFMRGLIVNTCMTHNRKNHRIAMITFTEEYNEVQVEDTALEQYLQLGVDEIKNLLLDMPEGYKTVFLLHVMDEFSHKEIGEILGISAETSRSQYLRAKRWILKNTIMQNKATQYGLF